jgi:tetratricopeptide (TPR) repeat protein
MDVLQERKLHLEALGEGPEGPRSTLIQRRTRLSEETMAAADALHGLSLPPELRWLRKVESGSVARLFGDAEGLKVFADLHLREGAVYQQRGEPACAETRYARALELYLEVVARDPAQVDACFEAIRFLAYQVDPALLPPDYEGRLRRLRAH